MSASMNGSEWFLTDGGSGYTRYGGPDRPGILFTPSGYIAGASIRPRSDRTDRERIPMPEEFSTIRRRLDVLAVTEPDKQLANVLRSLADLYT